MLATLAREALPDIAVVDVVDSALTARPLRLLAPLPLDPDNSDGDALTGFARASVPAGALVRRMPPYLGVHRAPPVRSAPPRHSHIHRLAPGLHQPVCTRSWGWQAVEKCVEALTDGLADGASLPAHGTALHRGGACCRLRKRTNRQHAADGLPRGECGLR